VAAVFGGLAWYHPAQSGAQAVLPGVPVLSARRLPAAVVGLVADTRLAQRLEILLRQGQFSQARACMEVFAGPTLVYANHPDDSLLPASNVKLLTARAVLERLGPSATLRTEVRASAPIKAGRIDGSLYVVGGGDPLLATADYRSTQKDDFTFSREPVTRLENLADRVAASGVREVTGGVVGDDSRYDDQRSVRSWKPTYLTDGEVGAVGALVVNGGFVGYEHHPLPAPAPAASAAAALSAELAQRGVRVDGPASSGPTPAGAVVLASVDSLPVATIVGEMLRESDNLAAEMLTKELGFRFGGAGSWSAGLRVIRDTLAADGLDVSGLRLVDGSGLDRGDRATCTLLAATLTLGGNIGEAINEGLPVAAKEGTLVRRFQGHPAAGRLRAKTGSLTGVAALSGYMYPAPVDDTDNPQPNPPPAGPGRVTFALLVNGVGGEAAGRALESRVAAVLAAYPETPVETSFGPGT